MLCEIVPLLLLFGSVIYLVLTSLWDQGQWNLDVLIVGVDFKTKLVTIGGKKLKLAVWDTGEFFRFFSSSSLKGSARVWTFHFSFCEYDLVGCYFLWCNVCLQFYIFFQQKKIVNLMLNWKLYIIVFGECSVVLMGYSRLNFFISINFLLQYCPHG